MCLLVATAFFTVSVKAQTIAVSNIDGLDFGTVVAGDNATVLPTDPGAALFEVSITNQKGKGHSLIINFSLPSQLILSGGSATVPISFSAASGLYNTKESTSGATSFDPNQQTSFKFSNGNYYFYLGGSIAPIYKAQGGVYNDIITITVTTQ